MVVVATLTNSHAFRVVQNPGQMTEDCPGFKDCTSWNSSIPKEFDVEFPGPNHMTLHGHLYVPGINTQAELDALAGSKSFGVNTGPAPAQGSLPPVKKLYKAVIYNHGSEASPQGAPRLAKLYVDNGFVFFAPDRHGQGLSKDAGPYIVDLEKTLVGQGRVTLHELYNLDVIAAVDWLKQQRYVDKNHLIMTGVSYGGIQTLLTAEKDPGIRGYLAFTPGTQSWGNAAMAERLKTAAKKEKAPLFVIQAEGDYNLNPVIALAPTLAAKGDANRWLAKLYPRFGCTPQQAHGGFAGNCGGIAIWSSDGLKFIETAFK